MQVILSPVRKHVQMVSALHNLVCMTPYASRDSDVEGMSDGYDPHTSYGAIDGFYDPSMGWARSVVGIFS